MIAATPATKEEAQMFITVTKSFTVAALLTASVFDPSGANRLLLQFVVFSGAIVAAVQSIRLQEHAWTFCFVTLALLFNPLLGISFSNAAFRWLDLACLAGFLVSLFVLQSAPLPSPLSITTSHREGSL
jgi:hypothetical protein